jgi:hypothetical protein
VPGASRHVFYAAKVKLFSKEDYILFLFGTRGVQMWLKVSSLRFLVAKVDKKCCPDIFAETAPLFEVV